ncbi:glycoside hydrolase family 140 protein [Olivibacter domesticus]|uniref:Putative collagen-binding domain of a collagenase n=1 Tax=Olivibacter domesticus TaxID=407022 RepID=A0A1H7U0X5_OLID1|nr:glycoside hydrolase family 140 protein [Olivibacter domesticus]SEL90435.1 Putative collagen-binding domain of a collagenase [Olivibacter domesticus]
MMKSSTYVILFALIAIVACTNKQQQEASLQRLKVSDNQRFVVTEDGKPFFWLGDTGWLLFSKLTKEEIDQYLEDRKQKGFNVIQVMLLHSLSSKNVYGDSALIAHDVSKPNSGDAAAQQDSTKLNYWQLVDYAVKKAAEKNIYMALVPVWGTNVKEGGVTTEQAKAYASFLANRYTSAPNIIWLNGGDLKGSDSIQVWKTIGNTLNELDSNHLITFHPRGRTTSSEWFHEEPWLDFNMFQSGHRRYDQDTSADETNHYGEDNWRFVQGDYQLKPTKPTIDGEPSYEGIPQGLHDPKEPRWTDKDIRRYAYWSVFSGAFGFTYGNNSVMQFLNESDSDSTAAYGATELWQDAIKNPGAGQMQYLKELMLSKSFLDRVPDQSLLAENGEKYDYKVATRGKDYALIYTYNGGTIKVNAAKLSAAKLKASWFDPRKGEYTPINEIANEGVQTFETPGGKQDGNDWVLVLEAI